MGYLTHKIYQQEKFSKTNNISLQELKDSRDCITIKEVTFQLLPEENASNYADID